ncbi:hypothetical protein ACFONA_03660 [Sphingomonas hylomeconis]|uniref:Secreted protein n=2 Tax=Sphingomonas hylomeconis TaxID=1395958 RepID=A0ABV7SSS4_9SPHN
MHMFKTIGSVLLAMILALLIPTTYGAAAGPQWMVERRLFGKPAKDIRTNGKNPAYNLSRRACATETTAGRIWLTVNDQGQGAQIVSCDAWWQ